MLLLPLLLSLLICGCVSAPTEPDELYFEIVGLPIVNVTTYRLTREAILTLTHEEEGHQHISLA